MPVWLRQGHDFGFAGLRRTAAGINLIRSTRASIAATLEPIGAGILSYIFLHEYMQWPQILGGVLVIAAVIYLQLTQEHDEQAPNLLREKTKIHIEGE